MNLTLKDLVKSPNFARFKRFRKGELVYAVFAPDVGDVDG